MRKLLLERKLLQKLLELRRKLLLRQRKLLELELLLELQQELLLELELLRKLLQKRMLLLFYRKQPKQQQR